MSRKLNILVIHGYVQTASTVANNTIPLQKELEPIANLNYVDGPPLRGEEGMNRSRPWWWLDGQLEMKMSAEDRWDDTVQWWSDHLSQNEYDGVIGLSQGAAMTALLISMIQDPARVPGFRPHKPQNLRFAILCSGFISNYPIHADVYNIPSDLPSLHTVDDNDMVVPAARTIALRERFNTYLLMRHNEGHSIPVRGDWPRIFREYIQGVTGIGA